MNIVLKRPVISEKSMKQAGIGLYTFIVDKKATKPEIAKAVENKFSVDVTSVKTVTFKSETKMQRGRRGYFTVSGFKKAMVNLKNGQKIALFETETPKEEVKEPEVKEKKSVLKGTKVKIEKADEKKENK